MELGSVAGAPAPSFFAKGLEQAARHERQDQVDHKRHAVDLHLAVVHAGDRGSSVHKVEHADDRKHRRILDVDDELVGERRNRIFNALGEHDFAHGLPLRKTQRARCLGLAGIDGLDAAAQDLHHVGGGVERDGDEAGGEGAPNLVGLGGLKAHATQNGEARVIDEQALDHHGRAAHDGGVDGRKAAADTLKEAHQVVVHAIEGLNTQEHKEQRQEECNDGAEGRERNGDLDTADEEVATLVGHVDQARQKVARVGIRDNAHLHQVDKRHDATVHEKDRRDGDHDIAAQARAVAETLGCERRLFAIVAPVHKLGDERRRRHDNPGPKNRP